MSELVLSRWSKHPYFFINGTVPDYLVTVLNDDLRYWVFNAERTDAFKYGVMKPDGTRLPKWDGFERLLYQTKSGVYYFPAGLLHHVTRVLDTFGSKYRVKDITLEDVRDRYEPLNLKWTGYELRDYQEEIAGMVIGRGGGIISAPTGGGKSLIMAYLGHHYNLPFIICVHTKDLLNQWHRVIGECFDGYKPGIVGASKREFLPITIATTQTLAAMVKKGEAEKLNFPVFMQDECHRVSPPSAYMVAMHCNAPVRIGASATIRRADGADLKIEACIGKIAGSVTALDLVNRGLLARPRFEFIRLDPLPWHGGRDGRKYNEVYINGIIANEERNQHIIRVATQYAEEGHQVYVHVDRIDHGEHLTSMIPGAVWLCGRHSMKTRKKVLEQFGSREIRVLVSTLLKEGIDIPTMDVFITGSSGKSPVAVIQRIGRVLRINPDKSEAVIVDFIDTGKYLDQHFADRYWLYKETFGELVPNL
jgi:superfamily II DNA or RNA helicase